ncbi:hypothetical protein N7456_007539 [Penicillium angulare]|uniref:Uncharacterized protein n=1 Tax=Penicillium angulare TaxID=116970 RepID=A0A9W9FAX2_9EURO|nr:hypothetical protein N7456_007539 [Penicillium angulare]
MYHLPIQIHPEINPQTPKSNYAISGKIAAEPPQHRHGLTDLHPGYLARHPCTPLLYDGVFLML